VIANLNPVVDFLFPLDTIQALVEWLWEALLYHAVHKIWRIYSSVYLCFCCWV